MKKNIIKYSILVAIAVLIGITAAHAGSLTPPGSPAKTMYTLGDLYTLINTGTTSASTNFTTPGSVSSTFYSLSNLVSAFASSTKTLSASTTTVSYGIYQATNLATIDTDLVATNIKSGATIFGVSGTVSPGAVHKTGQTTCYDASGNPLSCSGTGQDGDTQPGIARSYIDNGDGTITDNDTGLTWQKQDDATTRNWTNALAYCNANTAGLPGSGWRLPSVLELQSIVDFSTANPAINSTYFPSTQSNFYWSATTYQYPGNQYNAWLVYFYDGVTSSRNKSVGYYVRCVRG
jgi:hypothetical protein